MNRPTVTTKLIDEIQRLRTYPTREEKSILDDVIEIVKDKENWELSQVAKLETVVSNSEGLYPIESVREASSEMKSILDNYR